MPEPAVQNNDVTTDAPKTGGVTGKGFQQGQSGNPKGRPKGIGRKTRELVGDDGEVLVRFWIAGMHGKLPNPNYDEEHPERAPEFLDVDVKDRIVASRLLAERGWGKPPQFAPMEDDDPLDFGEREAQEMAGSLDARMDELAAKRAARAADSAAS